MLRLTVSNRLPDNEITKWEKEEQTWQSIINNHPTTNWSFREKGKKKTFSLFFYSSHKEPDCSIWFWWSQMREQSNKHVENLMICLLLGGKISWLRRSMLLFFFSFFFMCRIPIRVPLIEFFSHGALKDFVIGASSNVRESLSVHSLGKWTNTFFQ